MSRIKFLKIALTVCVLLVLSVLSVLNKDAVLAMLSTGQQNQGLVGHWLYSQPKNPLARIFGDSTKVERNLAYHLVKILSECCQNVKAGNSSSVEVTGFAPAESWMVSQILYSSTPTPS